MSRARPSVEALVDGVRGGDRALLARAITLVESRHPDHRADAEALLVALGAPTKPAYRVGVTGVPGVGKSTFLDAFGMNVLEEGHRVAVLAVDPTSERTGGSILGDKTRMARLAADPRAFIRPSPSQGTLGGVARRTRETIRLVEAAGYDVVLVETVGVGQSETLVAQMVDFFLVLMLPGAGDELQGIKRGIMELADLIAVNKADGQRVTAAKLARRQYASALHTLQAREPAWTPQALTCSALGGDGLVDIWGHVVAHREALVEAKRFDARRHEQDLGWLTQLVEDGLRDALAARSDVVALRADEEARLARSETTPAAAADRLLRRFLGDEET